jgi:chemotaxis protein MotB
MKNLKRWPSASGNTTDPLPVKRANLQPLHSPHKASTDKGTDIWLLTLSDLLMLLVICFVFLFAVELQKQKEAVNISLWTERREEQTARQASVASPKPSVATTSAAVEKDLTNILSREEGQEGVMVDRIADRVILTFPERIVFDPGQAELKPAAQLTLGKVASFIRERGYLIAEVQGHTDDRPINNTRYPSNWELSADRATQVAKALISLGVDPTHLSVKGFGEYHPLCPNDSDENRLKNRRVEIQLSIPPQ